MARLPWIRLFTEARNDRKLELLTDAEHRIWFRLLCYSAEDEPRGVFAIDTPEDGGLSKLAIEVADADDEKLTAALRRMQQVKVLSIDGDLGYFPAFGDRQYTAGANPSEAPDSVAERVRRHRAKAKQ